MSEWNSYLLNVDQEKRKSQLYVLETAEKYIPDSQRVISYQIPTIKQDGKSVIAAAAWKNHIGVYPFGGKAVESIKPQLKNAVISKGTLQFKYDDLPTEEQIKLIVSSKLKSL